MTAGTTIMTTMSRILKTTLGLGATFALLSGAAAWAGDQTPASTRLPVTGGTVQPGQVSFGGITGPGPVVHWTRPRSALNPLQIRRKSADGAALPLWSRTVTSPLDNLDYTYTEVGIDPGSPKTIAHRHTQIQVQPILLTLEMPGQVSGKNLTFSPVDPMACTSAGQADTISAYQRLKQSPLFKRTPMTSNGVQVSGNMPDITLINAFQRAQFWNDAQNTDYGVSFGLLPEISVMRSAPPLSVGKYFAIGCSPFTNAGKSLNFNSKKTILTTVLNVNFDQFDLLVQEIVQKYAKPNQLTIIVLRNFLLSFDVWERKDHGKILGYHNAISGKDNSTLTYAVSTMLDSGIYTDTHTQAPLFNDISIWSHELAEWVNDPYGTNPTPTWGKIGQQKDCQDNLEVGDPLTGTEYALTLDNFTYHFQDLAFVGWFYDTSPQGTGKQYSFMGGLTTASTLCKVAP